jgi:hypothetical protein
LVNTASVTVPEGVDDPDLENNSQTDTNQVILPTGSIAGQVFFDRNGDVVLGEDDSPIWGVRIRLTGTDVLGQNVDRTVQTDVFGHYEFVEVLPGEYQVAEEQPALFADGGERAGADGTLGTNPSNDVLALTLAPGQQAEGLDFGEGNLQLSKRDFLAGPPPSGE